MSTAEEIELTFLIADLSGYTALTEAHGNLQAAEVVGRYVEIVERCLARGTRLLERVGDEVLAAGGESPAVLHTAVRLRDAVGEIPLFPTVRMGLHRGGVVSRGGRFFGGALNLTARIAAHARGGQILCSQAVASTARDVEGVTFRRLGEVRFKNVTQPVPLFEIVTANLQERPTLDPVCRMRVEPESAPARLPYAGTTYYFCSLECAKAFADAPDDYAVSGS